MKTTKLSIAIALILSGAMASGAAFAARPPGAGGGGGGGGGNPGGEETAAQNLSVPTIMVGTPVGGLSCGTPAEPSALKPPTGTPLSGYTGPADNPLDPDDYYWVQKVHTWQAQCFNDVQAMVFGAWGDNLGGDANLKVGSPIRVELVLENQTEYDLTTYPALETLAGYTVIKLEDKLDRESAYGHLAGVNEVGTFVDIPTSFEQAQWLVHDSQITFSVQNVATGTYAVQPGTSPTAEINATGKVVYGYNLRVGVAGQYKITFTSSTNVEFLDVDAGTLDDAHNVSILINVVAGGGGGGGGGKPR